jgi:class 3 adenylate cyclase/predicted metal-dependent HD superfamily phosphohydrolase
MKSGEKSQSCYYNKVTILYAVIHRFSRFAEETEWNLRLNKLNALFNEFDNIVENYHIEKVKTNGNAYMCAGGIPNENRASAVEVILSAMEMQNYMKKAGENKISGRKWDLSIGIDTGPVFTGVAGENKLSYDVRGSAVDLASRMGAAGAAGRINISENTYELVKDYFICKYVGKTHAINKGQIGMYFVESLKPKFAGDLQGQLPNRNFRIHLQLSKLNDLEEDILEKMEKKLPDNLFYHNVKHTIDVVTQVELIGNAEGISNKEMLLVKTAALFHDIGFLTSYDCHEEESVRMAREILPEYHYTGQQIEEIKRLIMATQMPPEPGDHLEKIICDADLDYLGRSDFVPVAYNLYKELKIRNKIHSFEQWKKIQIRFIKQHNYFTRTAQKMREVNKKRQLDKILRGMKRNNLGDNI